MLRWCMIFFFHPSLTHQIYDLFEGNSERLWLFIGPPAPPALRSLIRCFLCPAPSDQLNHRSLFFTVHALISPINHASSGHARKVHLAWHQRVFSKSLLVQTCPPPQQRTTPHKYITLMKWSFNGSQTGRNTSSDRDVSLINSFKMTNDV